MYGIMMAKLVSRQTPISDITWQCVKSFIFTISFTICCTSPDEYRPSPPRKVKNLSPSIDNASDNNSYNMLYIIVTVELHTYLQNYIRAVCNIGAMVLLQDMETPHIMWS